MRTRFNLSESGDLEDRHGRVLLLRDLLDSKIVSITVEHVGDIRGGDVVVEEQQALELENTTRDGGSGGKGADAVWATYVEAMEPRDKVLHPAERKLIVEALKVATVAECQRAIWGCRRSSFHMGDNAARRKYNRLSHILKGKRGVRTLREQIDFMLDLADKHGVGDMEPTSTGSVTVDPAKLERMKRQVFRAFDMPGSEQAAEQAERAEAWLTEHGWRVVRNGNDRPRIERKDS